MDRILSAENAVDVIYEERRRNQSGTNGHSSAGNSVSGEAFPTEAGQFRHFVEYYCDDWHLEGKG
jgi:hypothetical protein